MNPLIALVLLGLVPLPIHDDAARCREVLDELALPEISFGSLIVEAGQHFMGRPYVGYTLEAEGPEQLVVNLSQFDCFTFMETSIALAHTARSPQATFATYRAALQDLRYRQGVISGYASRLHYTSDWAYDNQAAGLVVDRTLSLGGIPYKKDIHFMTQHRKSYQQLKANRHFRAMRRVERQLNKHKRYYLPKASIPDIEHLIEVGDILAITTTIEGLDIVHVGFAIFRETRLHMLHASSTTNQVMITQKPLAQILAKSETRSGIMVFHPLRPKAPSAEQ